MGLVDRNREPTPFELRTFGLAIAAFFGVAGWIAWRRYEATGTATVIWSLAGALLLVYYALPALRRPMYFTWMTVFFPLGWVISHALLAIVYYLVLTPIGLVARMLGHDPLARNFDRQAQSYWTASGNAPPDPSRYFKQF